MRRLTAFLLAAIVMALGSAPGASADDPILYTVTYVEVIPPATAQAAALLRQYREAGRKDQSNLRLEVVQRLDRPNQFVILAAWRSPQAHKAHAAAPPAADFRARLQPHLASPNDERLHAGLSVGAAPAGVAAGGIFAVTHVDVIPPRKDDSLGLLRQLAEDSRKEPDNLRLDVVQQTNRPNHFTVVEVWRDRAAFDAHGMAAHTRRFREQLAPLSGALYDERLYAILN
jgi:quinol monooxygenase YgiN